VFRFGVQRKTHVSRFALIRGFLRFSKRMRSIRLGEGGSGAAATVAHTTEATATDRGAHQSHGEKLRVFARQSQAKGPKTRALKRETHAARWGLLRGYSCKATKWVDFVMTDSTRRESCHFSKIIRLPDRVKGELRRNEGGIRAFTGLRVAIKERKLWKKRVNFRPNFEA
jgi:hypothetical protein